MTEYIGEYVTATDDGSGIMEIEIVGQHLYLTRDEAYELQDAINAVITAMAFDEKAVAK